MTVQRCGTCHFAKMMPQDFSSRICIGVPPTPHFGTGPKGDVMRMISPVVNISREACALYRQKDAADAMRDITAMQANEMMKQAQLPLDDGPTPKTKQ